MIHKMIHIQSHSLPTGSSELDLTHLTKPAKTAANCSLNTKWTDDYIDLFSNRVVRGWWPVSSNKSGEDSLMVSSNVVMRIRCAFDAG